MSIYEDDLIGRVGMSQAEACTALEIEQFKTNLSKITDDNINAAFEQFDKEEITEMLCQDQVWFKLSDRQLSRNCLEEELSEDSKTMLKIIREASTIEREIEILATNKVDEIIAEYEISA